MPLKSPEVCRDWALVSRLAERSIKSVCRQTHGDFRLVLVCHRRPDFAFTHPALTIIEEDFPVPGADGEERMADKSRKIWRGLVEIRGDGPAHVMFVDADDCVSRRLAALSAAQPEAHGWFFRTGYVHDHGSRWVLRKSDFHLMCGTSHILRVRPEELPQSATEPETAHWIGCHGHREIDEFLRRRGTPLAPLPFPGAIYNTGTGETWTGLSLRTWHSRRILLYKLLNYRPCTRAIREEFGLYPLDPSPAA
jgi:hypothetical protein